MRKTAVTIFIITILCVSMFAILLPKARASSSATVDSSNIAPAESILLNSGSKQYFFVGSTAGGSPMNTVTWIPDLNVIAAYSGNQAINIGTSTSNSGSYYSTSGNHGIAAAGVSGFTSYSTFTASTTSGTGINLQFTTTSGDLVVILVGGEGDGNIALSGINAQTLVDQTYSEAGSNVIASEAIYSAQLSTGTYTASFSSITYWEDTGTSIGAVAYVFTPSSSNTDTISLSVPAINSLEVNFNGVALPGSLVSYIQWNWGDGSINNGWFCQSHTYASSGTYQVTVTAHYDDGTTATTSKSVYVSAGEVTGGYTNTITAGAGGSISYSSCIGTGITQSGQSTPLYLAAGAAVSVTANPSGGYSFNGWSATSGIYAEGGGSISTISANVNFYALSNVNIQANFIHAQKASTETVVSLVPNPVSVGTGVNCVATISGGNSPTGTVTWTSTSNSGTFNRVQSAVVITGSKATSSTTYTDTSSGTVTITATYNGDGNNSPSNGNKILRIDPSSSSVVSIGQGICACNGYIYAVDTSANQVDVYSQTTGDAVASPISVGNSPVSLAVFGQGTGDYFYSSLCNFVLCANQGDGTVSIINSLTNTVVQTQTVGKQPVGIATDSVSGLALITDFGSNQISILNFLQYPQITTYSIPLSDSPTGIAVDPYIFPPYNSPTLYVSLYNSQSIQIITNYIYPHGYASQGTITVGAYPMGICTAGSFRLYVANSGSGTVSVIGLPITTSSQVTTITTGGTPVGVANTQENVDNSPSTMFVMSSDSNQLSCINDGIYDDSATLAISPSSSTITNFAQLSATSIVLVNAQNQIVIENTVPLSFEESGGLIGAFSFRRLACGRT